MRTSREKNLDGGELTPTQPIKAHPEYRLPVRYVECDPMHVAHHGTYVPLLEAARTEPPPDCRLLSAPPASNENREQIDLRSAPCLCSTTLPGAFCRFRFRRGPSSVMH